VIGAGVAGLSSAYALAARGHKVTIFDKAKPLAGASGNIRGFLAPKLTSLKRLETNLHAIGYLASCRFYPYLTVQTGIEILQTTGCLDLLSHNRLQLDGYGEWLGIRADSSAAFFSAQIIDSV
jgi:tRNA 5-methylaminomethyl-2-thiouridine biosynthesis bifunctional protein